MKCCFHDVVVLKVAWKVVLLMAGGVTTLLFTFTMKGSCQAEDLQTEGNTCMSGSFKDHKKDTDEYLYKISFTMYIKKKLTRPFSYILWLYLSLSLPP